VLLEGVPGLGKTLLVKTLSESLELSFARSSSRPTDARRHHRTNIIVEDAGGRKHFQFQQGPLFAHIVLADDQPRDAQDQSALLEGMQEASVTGAASRDRCPRRSSCSPPRTRRDGGHVSAAGGGNSTRSS